MSMPSWFRPQRKPYSLVTEPGVGQDQPPAEVRGAPGGVHDGGAAPPSHTLSLIDELAGIPLVLWTVHRGGDVHEQFGMADIVLDGGTVGTPMVANVLTRAATSFALVAGAADDAGTIDRLRGELEAAVLARRLRGARIGRIGGTVPGYLCVDAPDDALERALGVEVVRIAPGELQQRANAARGTAAQDVVAREVAATFDTADDLTDGNALGATFRLAAALRSLDDDYRLAAGTVNCHVPEIRYADDPGVTPCFALGRETSQGVPWTCTGDVLTAVAMLVAKRLSGAALYHEIESIDAATGECVLANSGEHDLAWCPPDHRPRLQPNPWFRGDDRCGACVVSAAVRPRHAGGVHAPPRRAQRVPVRCGRGDDHRAAAAGQPHRGRRLPVRRRLRPARRVAPLGPGGGQPPPRCACGGPHR